MTLNLLVRSDGNSVDGGMTNLVAQPTRLTCNVAGKYLIGAAVEWADPADVANNRRDMAISMGIPSGANVWHSISSTQQGLFREKQSLMSFVQMAVGEYLELWLFSTTADATNTNASASLWANWMAP